MSREKTRLFCPGTSDLNGTGKGLKSKKFILQCELTNVCVMRNVVEASWNVMAHAQKPNLVFRWKGRVHLNWRGRQFSRLLAAEVCASAVVMLDTACSEVVWRLLATHSICQFPLHFPSRASPCAITFQLESTLHIKEIHLLCAQITFGFLLHKVVITCLYKVCLESIQPFWISREPVMWSWCSLAASQRRPYCASMNSHSPMGLVGQQWAAIDWACVLCDRHTGEWMFMDAQ